ncbi:MAG: hypothetical protein JSS49_18300 [Planctomycetes bacterium]|nr:hypothetical protein [Planctomycetota bacterium]
MVSVSLNLAPVSGDEPLVQRYLHTGQLARGEQVLESALEVAPEDDQLRFSLAVLQLFRGVERLGQSLYEFGCLPENNMPFLRFPVHRNPDPSTITYPTLRRILIGFQADLAAAETTLAGIRETEVKLPLRLADVRLDLTGSGQSQERMIDILRKMMGRDFRDDKDNPDFLICLDRGDVAWLRAYCHLLMGMIDLQLAVDGEAAFDLQADQHFAKPKRRFEGPDQERWNRLSEVWQVVRFKDPARLRHFRLHFLKVCELNRETWAYIRAETDNDHEWLPNPRQTGVLRMPVSDEMIDAWLQMVAEVERAFNGQKKLPAWIIAFFHSDSKKGMNLQVFLDEPPETIEWERLKAEGVREKYLDGIHPDVDIGAFLRVGRAFQNTLAVGYAAWFN